MTMRVPAAAEPLRRVGILRAYHSFSSLCGWVLVPPVQHGGFGAMTLTELFFENAAYRERIEDGGAVTLRFSPDGSTVVELERDHALLSGPPRVTRDGRYLYPGGRRRTRAERWML